MWGWFDHVVVFAIVVVLMLLALTFALVYVINH